MVIFDKQVLVRDVAQTVSPTSNRVMSVLYLTRILHHLTYNVARTRGDADEANR